MTSYWNANHRALSVHGEAAVRGLLAEVQPLGPAPDLGLRSRAGLVVPGVAAPGPAGARALVSAFDPAREAGRWAEAAGSGTAVLWGAAGPDLARALAGRGVALQFWVEPRLAVWRALLTWCDWTLVPDGWVPVTAAPPAWDRLLADRYHPLWDGALATYEWRPATQGSEGVWDPYRAQTRRTLERIGSDASTQARFGERWYRNALQNLRRLRPVAVPLFRGTRVVIAGAGPSLGDALDDPAERRWLEARSSTGDALFSTDTALPALGARGVRPDLILCLDGQLPSYHHFVPERPAGVPLLADLCALPLGQRLGLPVVRFLTAHPFSAVVRRHFPSLPRADGSLGNVSGLALQVARALGAARIDTWGVDLAYRDGQAYTRGTYVEVLAQRRADRLGPLESRLTFPCYGSPGLERQAARPGAPVWMTTPLLREYRKRWEDPPPVVPGLRLAHEGAEAWAAFAAAWERRLRDLPLPPSGRPLTRFTAALPEDRREDWLALWPLALALKRLDPDVPLDPARVRDRALDLLKD